MKTLAASLLALCVSSAPAVAQDDGDMSEGFDLMGKGAQLLMEGILKQLDPALTDLQTMLEEAGPQLEALLLEMGPALIETLGQLDDFAYYDRPEILPNGDIVIRRSKDAPPYVKPEPETEIPEGIEL